LKIGKKAEMYSKVSEQITFDKKTQPVSPYHDESTSPDKNTTVSAVER